MEQFQVKKPQEHQIDLDQLSDFEKVLQLHGGKTVAETKYDGNGIIIDNRRRLKLYSLSKNEWDPRSLPEIIADLHQLPKGFYIGELVGKHTHANFTNQDEFAAVSARNLQKYTVDAEKLAENKPLEIRLYHLLELRGKMLADKPLEEMRRTLDTEIRYDSILPVDQYIFDDAAQLQQKTREQFAQGKEGFVVKNPEAPYAKLGEYVVGKRNDDWIKIKKNVTFDLVVLGLYQTPARLKQGWPASNALLGSYNEETGLFETVTKLTFPSKEIAQKAYEQVSGLRYSWNEEQPYLWQNKKAPFHGSHQVKYSPKLAQGTPAEKIPFLYVENPQSDSIVLEVSAMEVTSPKRSWHSCGIETGQVHSLRQPVLERFREKKPSEATTTQQLINYIGGK